jgi:hypothetical protein
MARPVRVLRNPKKTARISFYAAGDSRMSSVVIAIAAFRLR